MFIDVDDNHIFNLNSSVRLINAMSLLELLNLSMAFVWDRWQRL